jgi:two-component system sensor histidine kinase PilS (NtrC family)
MTDHHLPARARRSSSVGTRWPGYGGTSEDLARALRWLIGIRLVVVTSVVLPYFLLQLSRTAPGPDLGPLDTLYFVAAIAYCASLVYLVLYRGLQAGWLVAQAYLQFVGDLLLISGLVYSFGGITSPFSLLYLIVVAVASAMLRRSAGTTVATIAYALYATTLLGIFFGWLPNQGVPDEEGATVFRLVYNLAVHLFAFYAVALLTSYLAAGVSQAEQQLEAKAESLADLEVVHQDIIQSMSSGLITTDRGGSVTSINRAGCDILGRSERELVGRPIASSGLLDPETWQHGTAEVERAGKARLEVDSEIASGRRCFGFTITRLCDATGVARGYILIFQDLTEWRQLQESLAIKDRMAAVGQLAAGLAHEIGNPLAAISGSVQMLATGFPADSPRRKLLDITLKESQRLDRTIKDFLRYARPRERQLGSFDVARLIAENVSLLRNSPEVLPSHVVDLAADAVPIPLLADRDQVSQIFWNLARNALRAMPEGGTLRVTTRAQDGDFALQISDTGRGMSERERANLFHPFQSFFDGGTGLGMAIVYRIVQEHGGRLDVQSRPGEGTTITVLLPLAGPAERQEGAPEDSPNEPMLRPASPLEVAATAPPSRP